MVKKVRSLLIIMLLVVSTLSLTSCGHKLACDSDTSKELLVKVLLKQPKLLFTLALIGADVDYYSKPEHWTVGKVFELSSTENHKECKATVQIIRKDDKKKVDILTASYGITLSTDGTTEELTLKNFQFLP